jgi:hypothetical protein
MVTDGIDVSRSAGTEAAVRRTLSISLTVADLDELNHLADDTGLDPSQLATVWVIAALNAEAARRSLRAGHGGALPRGDHAEAPVSLHDEIINVLADRGAPMTVGEIAAAIRDRGQYQSPRTGRPITSELVSRRVANPYYRRLFKRTGRYLELGDARAVSES